MARRGRPAKYATDHKGLPIMGLTLDTKGRYHTTHHKPKKYFGTDKEVAIYKFRQWQTQQNKEPISEYEIADNSKNDVLISQGQQVLDQIAISHQLSPNPDDYSPTPPVKIQIPLSLKFAIVKEIFSTFKPSEIADQTGIEQFRNIHNLKTPPPAMALVEVRELFAKRKDLTKKEQDACLSKWDNFVSIIKCKTLDDITEDHIYEYYDVIMEKFHKENYKPKGIKNYLSKVVTVINHARTYGRKDKE